MSKTRETKLQCPDCGKEINFTIWESVNVDLDPEEKDRIKAGTFNQAVCPKCGFSGGVQYPCLYHDMTLKKQVYVLPDNFDVEREKANETFKVLEGNMADLPVEAFVNGYSFRAVHNFNELREKVCIWDDGLDDKVIEMYKAVLVSNTQDEENPVESLYFVPEEDDYKIEALFRDGSPGYADFDMSFYEKLDIAYHEKLQELEHKTEYCVIDIGWGRKFLDENPYQPKKKKRGPEADFKVSTKGLTLDEVFDLIIDTFKKVYLKEYEIKEFRLNKHEIVYLVQDEVVLDFRLPAERQDDQKPIRFYTVDIQELTSNKLFKHNNAAFRRIFGDTWGYINYYRFKGKNYYNQDIDRYERINKAFPELKLNERTAEKKDEPKRPAHKPEDGRYIYCSVVFGGYGRKYSYIADEDIYEVGDKVIVPVGEDGQETIAEVVSIDYYQEEDAPYPPDKAKHIIGKSE